MTPQTPQIITMTQDEWLKEGTLLRIRGGFTMTTLQQHLKDIGACQEARAWAGDRTPRQAWDEAPRADWLLWWAGRLGVDKVLLVRCACQIARTVLHLIPAGEERPRLAIEAAERWCENPTEENRKKAARAAKAAAWAAATVSFSRGYTTRSGWCGSGCAAITRHEAEEATGLFDPACWDKILDEV
jgi:hypothetical protein